MNEFETCENCNRTIGKLETAMSFTSTQGTTHTVCPQCHARLSPPPPATNWPRAIFWLIFWLFLGGPFIYAAFFVLWANTSPQVALSVTIVATAGVLIMIGLALNGTESPPKAPDHAPDPTEATDAWPDSWTA